MSRVTSLTSMSDQQLNRWIKRIALLFVVVLVAFVAFYAVDRFRLPQAPIVDQKMTALEEAVRTKPEDLSSRGQLADMYVVKGRYADAIAQYDMILKTGKFGPLAHLGRGEANRLSGQLDAAAGDYAAVIDSLKDSEMAATDPRLQSAYFGLGSVLMTQDRAADAIDPLIKAIAIKRSDADALNLLGSAYLKTGDATKAIVALNQAIAYVPSGWAEPYTTLAAAYKAAGDGAHAEWATAMAELATGQVGSAEARLKGIADGPTGLDAAIGLGVLYETQGDTASAAQWYAKALAINPKNASALLGMGRVGAIPSGAPVASSPASVLPSLPLPGQSQAGDQ
jgi:tetratricopeptide (TPR) repeat protein